jgi:membrane protein DedA with SNARE-associated domain
MRLGLFTLLTAIGSGVWNLLFVGGGYLLGSRWQNLETYSNWLNYAVYAVIVGSVVWWVAKKVRKRRAAASPVD